MSDVRWTQGGREWAVASDRSDIYEQVAHANDSLVALVFAMLSDNPRRGACCLDRRSIQRTPFDIAYPIR